MTAPVPHAFGRTFFTFAIVASALSAAVSNASAKAPETLSPATPWHLDYSAKKCTAARVFGGGDQAVVLLLNQFGPGRGFYLSLGGKRFDRWPEGRLPIRFGPDEPTQQADYYLGNFGKSEPALLLRRSQWIGPRKKDATPELTSEDLIERDSGADRLAAVQWFEFQHLGSSVRLATGRLDKLFGELSRCGDDLVKSWGFDPATIRTLRKFPVPLSPPKSWLNSGDYPRAALWRGARAIVNVRLNVDATGKVTACDVQQATENGAEFPKVVCDALMKRAKFEPAIDASGKPVAVYWRNTVNFTLPKSR